MRVDEMMNKISNSDANTTSCTLEIAISTLKLIKMNREFQHKLMELSNESTNLLNSVLENPENHSMKERFKFSDS
jgi:hypothetical protein